MKPYYDDGQITLYHADARAMSDDDVIAGFILTDPPNELAGWELRSAFNISRMSVLVNVSKVEAWTDVDQPDAATVWHRPDRTLQGSNVDVMLHFGHRPGGISYIDDRGARATVHTAERGLKPWSAVIVASLAIPDEILLDPFAGSGTTLVAAKMFGMRAIGVELEEIWCRVAVNRLQAIEGRLL